jgi:saccharopine dehydrogenase-like NADP-dependent oxidoreductase
VAYSILVLGGYGNFGGKISTNLAKTDGINVIVAGRSKQKAERFVVDLKHQYGLDVQGVLLDSNQDDLSKKLADSGAQLVINASGPFQEQNYNVAEACIALGLNYIDLADGRNFVKGFEKLDTQAKENNVLAITGASSVPGLSSAVINEYLPKFKDLKEIKYGLAPGNRADRGEATVKAILGYVGRPFRRWENGNWVEVYGWQDIHRYNFPDPIGKRWLANCDIPDLELFPDYYPALRTIKFYAGLELSSVHLGMWLVSWIARLGFVDNWARYSHTITKMSCWFQNLGTDVGGMNIQLKGTGNDGKTLEICWDLVAEDGDGPQIPTIPSIILAKKIANGSLDIKGAQACVGLFSLEDFTEEVKIWNIWQKVNEAS